MPITFLKKRLWFPPVEQATAEGLLAVGGDLSPERLLLAYRNGVFPWFGNDEPILWWSPDPRFVLFPDEFVIRRSLRKVIRQNRFEIRYDTSFSEVIAACSQAPREGQYGTWITEEMRQAYCRLFELGWAHSVEAFLDGTLVGGLYGVAIGTFFFGESMFHTRSNASKVALAALVDRYRDGGMIDCQVTNPFFESMGARHIPRKSFLKHLVYRIDQPNMWQATAPGQAP